MKIALLALLVAASFPAAAQLVKCVDERGRTHYTDKPAIDCKGAKSQTQLGPAAEPVPKPRPAAPQAATRPAPQAAPQAPKPAAKAPPKPQPKAPSRTAMGGQERRMFDAECKNTQDMLDWLNTPAGQKAQNREARIDTLQRRLSRCS